jgi:hypothetical protein
MCQSSGAKKIQPWGLLLGGVGWLFWLGGFLISSVLVAISEARCGQPELNYSFNVLIPILADYL